MVSLGFSDLLVSAGDHIGHFYRTPEEGEAILIPFLKAGLEAGDQCVYMTNPDTSRRDICAALEAAQIDVERALTSGQLLLDVRMDSPEELRKRLHTLIIELPRRYRFLRWGGDMTWSLQQMPGSEILLEWEMLCNTLERPPVVFFCQYDLTQLLGSVIIDAFKTHPLFWPKLFDKEQRHLRPVWPTYKSGARSRYYLFRENGGILFPRQRVSSRQRNGYSIVW